MATQWTAQQAVTQPYWWPLPPLLGQPAPLEALIEGEVEQTSHGSFFRRRLVFPLGHGYGGVPLGDCLSLRPQTLAVLARDPALADLDVEALVFLDTETTGLAGGTGTYAFLVGLGAFATVDGEQAFVVEQTLMRSYGEERAMLSWLVERLAPMEALATFNGRCFDVPLLQTRFVLSRLRLDLESPLHLDLLPVARRLWRPLLGSCALQNLERQLLGLRRTDDVESFLIPAIFHQYLQDGDGRYLAKVFAHNVDDILAMVAVAARAGQAFDAGTGATPASLREPAEGSIRPAEHYSIGKLLEQLGEVEAAERSYRASLTGPLPVELRARAALALAALLKRARRYDEAAMLWQELADEAPAFSLEALIELAKYWEHRRRDPAQARVLAARARDRWLTIAAAGRQLPGLAATSAVPDHLTRRLARLERKSVATSAVSAGITASPTPMATTVSPTAIATAALA